MKLYNNKKDRKSNSPKASEEKKRDKRSPNSTRKAQKCNEILMYETKGVEPSPKGKSNALEVFTQYNPQTLFEPL